MKPALDPTSSRTLNAHDGLAASDLTQLWRVRAEALRTSAAARW